MSIERLGPNRFPNGTPLHERVFGRGFEDGNGCWVWTGGRDSYGYGSLSFGNKTYKSHRVAYQYMTAEIGPELSLDHLCRNTLCFNPEHLDPVTRGENVLRGNAGPVSHCKRGHPATPENRRPVNNGGTACRVCDRMWGRKEIRSAA